MMVAYSFKANFADDIKERIKRQTIRLPRKRHALPGEHVQLYQGMRTRHCRKIIPDPVCIGVDEIEIDLRSEVTPRIEVNGIVLDLESPEADSYAILDGFSIKSRSLFRKRPVRPIEFMLMWWRSTHGPIRFNGVAIRWEDRP